MEFDEWFEELKKIFISDFQWTKEETKTIDKKDWLKFYKNGMSPEEAFSIDMDSAGSL